MARYGLVCVLTILACGRLALAQETPPAAPSPGTSQDAKFAPSVPPDAAVITIPGICDHSATVKPDSSDCRTVVTRAEFDQMIDMLQPGTSPAGRKFFAMNHAKAVISAMRAQEMGLDKTQNYDLLMDVRHMNFGRLWLDEKFKADEWASVTDKDIETYYRDHSIEFERLNVDRVFVPKMPREQDSDPKLSAADQQKRKQAWFDELRQEAERLRARAVAGEDFLKLQREAYRLAGLRAVDVDSSSITLESLRRGMFTEGQRPVMDVKTGELSSVLEDQNGFFIFRVTARNMLPLDKVRMEIHDTLRKQRVKHDWNAVFDSVKISFDESYFGPETAEDRETILMTRPGAQP